MGSAPRVYDGIGGGKEGEEAVETKLFTRGCWAGVAREHMTSNNGT